MLLQQNDYRCQEYYLMRKKKVQVQELLNYTYNKNQLLNYEPQKPWTFNWNH